VEYICFSLPQFSRCGRVFLLFDFLFHLNPFCWIFLQFNILTPEIGKGLSSMEIVISGISGRFPESENISEFTTQLFDGIDMVTDNNRRWTQGFQGLPRRSGKLKTLDKFDAGCFRIPGKQAHAMDPQQRILLELVYEAIFDSGESLFSVSIFH